MESAATAIEGHTLAALAAASEAAAALSAAKPDALAAANATHNFAEAIDAVRRAAAPVVAEAGRPALRRLVGRSGKEGEKRSAEEVGGATADGARLQGEVDLLAVHHVRSRLAAIKSRL